MDRFVGNIDGVSNGELIGWALDLSNPSTPSVVTIEVDGVPVTRVLACQHRADVAAAYTTSGLHGFNVLLPERFFGRTVRIAVTCEDGQLLGSTGRFELEAERARRHRGGPCVLFMHIQKTAGTAFRDAILENYSRSEAALLYPDAPGIPPKKFHWMPEEQRCALRCVIGHFKYGIHELLGQPFEYVTMVRDPVRRVVSNYRHLCWIKSALAYTPDGGLNSLEEVLEAGQSMELDNLITRFFRGGEGDYPAGSVDQEWYERALENLQQFRFIGHQEHSNDAWVELGRRYAWLHGTLKKTNVLFESPMEVTERMAAAIAAYNKYDLLLYGKILSRRNP